MSDFSVPISTAAEHIDAADPDEARSVASDVTMPSLATHTRPSKGPSHATATVPASEPLLATHEAQAAPENIACGVSAACDTHPKSKPSRHAPPTPEEVGEYFDRRKESDKRRDLHQVSWRITREARDALPDMLKLMGTEGKPEKKGNGLSRAVIQAVEFDWLIKQAGEIDWLVKAATAFEPYAAKRGVTLRDLFAQLYLTLKREDDAGQEDGQ